MAKYLLKNSILEINRISKFFLVFALGFITVGCANKEIQQLQTSVSELETKLRQYQLQTSKETAETTANLQDVNQAVRESFQKLGYTQSSLESTLNQISNRLANLERDVAALQERMNRQENFTSETATLVQDTQKVTANLQETMETVRGDIEGLNNQFAQLRQDSQESGQQNRAQMNRIRDALTSQIAEIESKNREMYSLILKELGADVPKPEPAESSASGQVHVVESGDTLSKIAEEYGVTVRDLQEYNGISDPSLIRLGQKIRIP